MEMRVATIGLALALAAAACGPASYDPTPTPSGEHVVDVVAEDYAFDAPDEILSGWTTFRLHNEGEEVHFLLLTRLPEGRDYDEYVETVSTPVLEVWEDLRAGEVDIAAAFERLGSEIPAWYWTDARIFGGPGMIDPGGVSRVTLDLEPGTYVLECFMKTAEGEFHWVEGMLRSIEVLPERSAATEPEADVEMRLTTTGFQTSGSLRPGTNTMRVVFVEQPEAGFGNDVHLVRLDGGMEAEEILPWMDAFSIGGLAPPAPAPFRGGTHERAEGEVIYFTVEVEPGRYAWISEGPPDRRMFREFTVR